ncbi:hypothetical protein ACT3TS_03750 [Specibacter sp. AOP5-B1-6]|uniref:hypothetical protein n=1 Tax=Specibacter sp. AOP5-B1-6 TaxID=3457653 RepID=UPI00402B1CC1
MTHTIPSVFAASHRSGTASGSNTAACVAGMPLLRIDEGTITSGSAGLMTGAASTKTSAGVR